MAVFAIDFDGTCVEHDFPRCGPDVRGAVETLLLLVEQGHDLILWTMRSGEGLAEAVDWFADRSIPLKGVNVNPDQSEWTSSPKVYAHVYIDDAAMGCPLIFPPQMPYEVGQPRPYVDWEEVNKRLQADHFIPGSKNEPIINR